MQGPAFQLSKSHVIRPTGRMAAVVFSALVTSFTWVGPSQAKDISAAQMVSHFNTICLKTGTEVNAIAAASKKKGLEPYSKTQWSNASMTLNAHALTSDRGTAGGTIEPAKVTKKNWDWIRFNVADLANYKGKGTGCVVTAYGLTMTDVINGLAQLSAQYGAQVKVKSRGRVGQTTFKISGDTYRVIARPLKLQNLEFVALSVVRGH